MHSFGGRRLVGGLGAPPKQRARALRLRLLQQRLLGGGARTKDRCAKTILCLATQAAHRELPSAMSARAALVGCANGSKVPVFLDSGVSLVAAILLHASVP